MRDVLGLVRWSAVPVPFVTGVALGLRTGEIFLHYEILVSSTNSVSQGCIAGPELVCERLCSERIGFYLLPRVVRSNFMLVFGVAGVMVTCESTNWPV